MYSGVVARGGGRGVLSPHDYKSVATATLNPKTDYKTTNKSNKSDHKPKPPCAKGDYGLAHPRADYKGMANGREYKNIVDFVPQAQGRRGFSQESRQNFNIHYGDFGQGKGGLGSAKVLDFPPGSCAYGLVFSGHKVAPLVEFSENGVRKLGVVLETQDSGWSFTVSDKNNQRTAVRRENILFEWENQYLGQNYLYGVDDIPRIEQICAATSLAFKSHIKIAWGNYVDKGVKLVTPEMVATILFGPTPKPHEYYVAHCLLMEDDTYFSKEKIPFNSPKEYKFFYTFRCRSFKQVTQIERKKKDQLYYTQNLHLFLKRAQKKLGMEIKNSNELKEDLVWDPRKDAIFIEKIKKFALEEGNLSKTFFDILQPLGINPSPIDAIDLLVKLDVWGKYENLNLLKFSRRLDFTEEEIKKYDELSERLNSRKAPSWVCDQDVKSRRDLTHIQPTFAIDDEKSFEIDDCLSLELRSDGSTWLYIHIADPSRVVRPNDSLDLLARKRVCSIFVPEKSIPMFPPVMTMNHFSLLPSKANYALSYIVKLDPEGQIEHYEITPSIIDKINCLSYNEVDKILSDNFLPGQNQTDLTEEHFSSLKKLNEIALVRKRLRQQQGAIFLNVPIADIKVEKDGEFIDIKPLYPDSASRGMVAEYMILVGEITADFALKNKIPIPFRGQERKKKTPVLGTIWEEEEEKITTKKENNEKKEERGCVAWIRDTLKQFDKRRQLSGAKISTEARPHNGLSLKAYCQASSPIRRYLDLLVHYQIKAFLRGEKLPFHKEAITKLIGDLEQPQQDILKLSTQSQRYWLLRFFERQSPTSLFNALVLTIQSQLSQMQSEQPKSNADTQTSPIQSQPPVAKQVGLIHTMQVLLMDIGYEMGISLCRDIAPQRGDIIKIILKNVSVRENQVQFEEAT